MKKTILVVSMALVSWGTFAQHSHEGHEHKKEKVMTKKMDPMFKDKTVSAAYTEYLIVKNALVASNATEAKLAAEALQKTLASLENGKAAQTAAKKITETADLESQRTAFATLSNEMMSLVKKSEITMGEVYVDYCPMANSNSGAYWLSSEKEIKNPYFGEKMMKCGSVKETVK